ncbi:MAG TPA: NUDIX domain-containing protein [Kofleriaceae bacterium]
MIGAAGIAFDAGGRVLLVRDEDRGWSVPGGRVEWGERLTDACVREIREETGLEVRVVELAEVFERIESDLHYVIHDFLVEVQGGDLAAGDDALEAGWFTFAEVVGLRTTPGLLAVLHRALARARELGLAPHAGEG